MAEKRTREVEERVPTSSASGFGDPLADLVTSDPADVTARVEQLRRKDAAAKSDVSVWKLVNGNLLSRSVSPADVTAWSQAGWSTSRPGGGGGSDAIRRFLKGAIVDERGRRIDARGQVIELSPQDPGQFGPMVTSATVMWHNTTEEPVQIDINGDIWTVEPGERFTYGDFWEGAGFPEPRSDGSVPIPWAQLRQAILGPVEPSSEEDFFSRFADLFKSSGGRGGAAAPVYRKPDERLVREAVKGMLVALVGKSDPVLEDQEVARYLSEDKRAFDLRETEDIDPMQSVKESVRQLPQYKAIHTLRPDSTDEFTWVSNRQGALVRAGMSERDAQSFGVAQALVGASAQESASAAGNAVFQQSRRAVPGFQNDLRSAIEGVVGLL